MKKEAHIVVLSLDNQPNELMFYEQFFHQRLSQLYKYALVCTSLDITHFQYLFGSFRNYQTGEFENVLIPHRFVAAILEIDSYENPVGFLKAAQ